MERRDQYFTRLKALIEVTFKRFEGRKVLIISHSWGDNVFRCFLHWAGRADSKWVEKHIGVYANVAGPVLGVPKVLIHCCPFLHRVLLHSPSELPHAS